MNKMDQKTVISVLKDVESTYHLLCSSSSDMASSMETMNSVFQKYNNASKGLYISKKVTDNLFDLTVLRGRKILISFYFSINSDKKWEVEIDRFHSIRDLIESLGDSSFLKKAYTRDVVDTSSFLI